MSDKAKKKKGFTLVELLAVIVILGIVITVISISVAKTMKKAKIQSFVTSYETILDSVKTSIASKNLNLSDESEVICLTTDNCSKLYSISKDNYKMAVVKENDNKYIVAVTGRGSYKDISFDGEYKKNNMICSGNYCTSIIEDGEVKANNNPEPVVAIKYHIYNKEVAAISEGLSTVFASYAINDVTDFLTNKYNEIDENIIKVLNKELNLKSDNINITFDEFYAPDGDNDKGYFVYKITKKDSDLGYNYSFHDKINIDDKKVDMEKICMPKDTGNDQENEYSYYVGINKAGNIEDISAWASEYKLCNLPG